MHNVFKERKIRKSFEDKETEKLLDRYMLANCYFPVKIINDMYGSYRDVTENNILWNNHWIVLCIRIWNCYDYTNINEIGINERFYNTGWLDYICETFTYNSDVYVKLKDTVRDIVFDNKILREKFNLIYNNLIKENSVIVKYIRCGIEEFTTAEYCNIPIIEL